MRNLTFILALTLLSLFSYAQWQINGSSIYYNEGNVGIGTSNPNYKLEISGIEDYANDNRIFIRLINNSVSQSSLSNMRLYAGENGSFTSLSHMSETYSASPNQADFGNLWTSGAGLLLRANGGIIRMETSPDGGSESRILIDKTGLIGIGTEEPQAKLHIAQGDIYISDINRGIIMKSPDDNCWKGTIDNQGNLNFIQIVCPEIVTETNSPKESYLNDISVFPNPSENYISVKFDKTKFKKLKYAINDVSGRLIAKGVLRSTNEKIQIYHLNNGIYFISINDKDDNKLLSEKIIKN